MALQIGQEQVWAGSVGQMGVEGRGRRAVRRAQQRRGRPQLVNFFVEPFEFAGRYQQFENVLVADPSNPVQTKVYTTKVVTGGLNYYVRGRYGKIQANYNLVFNPSSGRPDMPFHNTRDDSFVISFQVAF